MSKLSLKCMLPSWFISVKSLSQISHKAQKSIQCETQSGHSVSLTMAHLSVLRWEFKMQVPMILLYYNAKCLLMTNHPQSHGGL